MREEAAIIFCVLGTSWSSFPPASPSYGSSGDLSGADLLFSWTPGLEDSWRPFRVLHAVLACFILANAPIGSLRAQMKWRALGAMLFSC